VLYGRVGGLTRASLTLSVLLRETIDYPYNSKKYEKRSFERSLA